jgi:two-component system sensor histidine kinase KdpD
LTASVLSALVWDFFFIPPRFTLTVGNGEDFLLLLMYFVVALLNGVINYRVRQFEKIQSLKAERENTLNLYNSLFSSLSHELRTPIAVVLGAADTLRENDTHLSSIQKKELLEEISAGSLRLSEQVENLLNMSRLEAGGIHPKKEWCDVADLVFGTAQKLTHESRNHLLKIELQENLPLVQLDFGLTEQVLQNLLTNAFRHTPPGSEVKITAKIQHRTSGHFINLDADAKEIEIVNNEPSYVLVLMVEDNGPGFPQDNIEKAFEKFFRFDKSEAEGTGLGLFIVRGFVEAQGGEVSLANRGQGGARVTIEFPTHVLNQAVYHE